MMLTSEAIITPISKKSINSARIIFWLSLLSLLFNGLGAYEVARIPVPWFSGIFSCLALIILLTNGYLTWPSGLSILVLLIFHSVLLTVIKWNSAPLMPVYATLPYTWFILARYVDLLIFIFLIIVFYNLALLRSPETLIDISIKVASILSVVAIYIYFAQIFNFWEPPRTRMGTGGQDFLTEKVRFSYAFHRALGTFREPSHLAQWLIAPFLFLFGRKELKYRVLFFMVLVSIFLTGSFLGILAILSGVISLLIYYGRIRISYSMLYLTAFCLFVFGLIVVDSFLKLGFFETIGSRATTLFQEGAEGTNRAYVYEYFTQSPPPLMGYGIGNSNIEFSLFRWSGLIQSHLSLYLNFWYSLGLPGLVLLLLFLFLPLLQFLGTPRADDVSIRFASAYIAWLVVFLGHAESFSVSFALIFAGLSASMKRRKLLPDMFFKSRQVPQ